MTMTLIEKIARVLMWEAMTEEERAELEANGITRETCHPEYEEMRVAAMIVELLEENPKLLAPS